VTFGIFICEECAHIHLKHLGLEQSYVKRVEGEMWDEWQLKSVSPEFGGNKVWYNLLKEYNLSAAAISKKYTSSLALYQKRKIWTEIQGKPFTEEKPAKNWHDRADKVGQKMMQMSEKAEQGILTLGQGIQRKVTEKGWKQKVEGLWGKKKEQVEEEKLDDEKKQ